MNANLQLDPRVQAIVQAMYTLDRPVIPTRASDRLSADVALAMEAKHKGLLLRGNGRVGKTFGARMLAQTYQWRPYPLTVFEMSYGNPSASTESYFMNWGITSAGLKIIKAASGPDIVARLCNHLVSRTAMHDEKMIMLICNEANRFSIEEYNHLVTLDNELEGQGKYLFVLQVSQQDADAGGQQGMPEVFPSHITGRFMMAEHAYTGLLWEKPEDERNEPYDDDVTMALREYDHGKAACSAYFLPKAAKEGWTLASQIGDIREEVGELRAQHNLPGLAPWPMKTFECFVYYLLVRATQKDPNLTHFTRDHIRQALRFCGYIQLEQSFYPERKFKPDP